MGAHKARSQKVDTTRLLGMLFAVAVVCDRLLSHVTTRFFWQENMGPHVHGFESPSCDMHNMDPRKTLTHTAGAIQLNEKTPLGTRVLSNGW